MIDPSDVAPFSADDPELLDLMDQIIGVIRSARHEESVEGGLMHLQKSLNAMMLLIAMLVEEEPSVRTKKDIRERSEEFGRAFRIQLQHLRDYRERTGLSWLDQLDRGGTVQ